MSRIKSKASFWVLTGDRSPQSVFGIQKSRFERVHVRIAPSFSKRFGVVEGFKGVAAIYRCDAFGFCRILLRFDLIALPPTYA
jgi:hypothetical protein